MSVIHDAAVAGQIDKIQKALTGGFLRRARDVNERDANGRTPLHHATARGHNKLVQFLIQKGADRNAQDNAGMSPLMLVLESHPREGTSVVHELLAHGAKVNERDSRQLTPLHFAAGSGSVETTRMIVEAGADLNAIVGGLTPVDWVLMNMDEKKYSLTNPIVVLLFKSGGRSRAPKINHTLAASLGLSPLVVQYLKGGDPITRSETSGLLYDAVGNGHLETAQILLAHGADVNSRHGRVGRSVMHNAAAGGHPRLIQWLLQNGASAKVADERGITPLHLAAGLGAPQICWVLSSSGEKVAVYGRHYLAVNETPDNMVVDMEVPGYCEAIKILLTNGADIEARGDDGYTPLCEAARSSFPRLVETLLHHGARVDVRPRDGGSLLVLAGRYNQGGYELLEKHGAR